MCIRDRQKVIEDEATGILILPDWPSQFWYHMFEDLIIMDLYLPPRLNLLYLPNNLSQIHPLHNHLGLRAALVSGKKVVKEGVSECVKDLVESSWAASTRNSYNSYIKRWTEYCTWKGIPSSQASVTEGVNYLSHLFEQGEK